MCNILAHAPIITTAAPTPKSKFCSFTFGFEIVCHDIFFLFG